jgi:hypothetical protein
MGLAELQLSVQGEREMRKPSPRSTTTPTTQPRKPSPRSTTTPTTQPRKPSPRSGGRGSLRSSSLVPRSCGACVPGATPSAPRPFSPPGPHRPAPPPHHSHTPPQPTDAAREQARSAASVPRTVPARGRLPATREPARATAQRREFNRRRCGWRAPSRLRARRAARGTSERSERGGWGGVRLRCGAVPGGLKGRGGLAAKRSR